MGWINRKKTCAHCGTKQTKREFEDRPACAECIMEIRVSRESVHRLQCPVDGTEMVKTINGEIILGRCPDCEGIWLDAGELEAIEEAANEEGMGAGVAVGMVVG